MNKCLIIVDIQNDFLENGALAIKNSNKIIQYVNEIIFAFYNNNNLIIATKDLHPNNHISFLTNDKECKEKWPPHCIENTWGEKYPDELSAKYIKKVFIKGNKENIEEYSAFLNKSTSKLNKFLKVKKITDIFIVGLAFDICVKSTALDALKLGYKVFIYIKGTAKINEIKSKKFIQKYKNKIKFIF